MSSAAWGDACMERSTLNAESLSILVRPEVRRRPTHPSAIRSGVEVSLNAATVAASAANRTPASCLAAITRPRHAGAGRRPLRPSHQRRKAVASVASGLWHSSVALRSNLALQQYFATTKRRTLLTTGCSVAVPNSGSSRSAMARHSQVTVSTMGNHPRLSRFLQGLTQEKFGSSFREGLAVATIGWTCYSAAVGWVNDSPVVH